MHAGLVLQAHELFAGTWDHAEASTGTLRCVSMTVEVSWCCWQSLDRKGLKPQHAHLFVYLLTWLLSTC